MECESEFVVTVVVVLIVTKNISKPGSIRILAFEESPCWDVIVTRAVASKTLVVLGSFPNAECKTWGPLVVSVLLGSVVVVSSDFPASDFVVLLDFVFSKLPRWSVVWCFPAHFLQRVVIRQADARCGLRQLKHKLCFCTSDARCWTVLKVYCGQLADQWLSGQNTIWVSWLCLNNEI